MSSVQLKWDRNMLADNVCNSMLVVKEAVADVAHDVKESVLEELQRNKYFWK